MPKRLNAEQNRQPTLFEMEEPSDRPSQSNNERPFSLPGIFLGTSSFTAAGWEGSFSPIGMRSKDFLRHYASQFQTVEIDSTFYGTPAASTVTNWNEKTPSDFIIAAKVPQVVTHEKVLVDCNAEFIGGSIPPRASNLLFSSSLFTPFPLLLSWNALRPFPMTLLPKAAPE